MSKEMSETGFICLRCGREKKTEQTALSLVDGHVCFECASSPQEAPPLKSRVDHEQTCNQAGLGSSVCSCALEENKRLHDIIDDLGVRFRAMTVEFNQYLAKTKPKPKPIVVDIDDQDPTYPIT